MNYREVTTTVNSEGKIMKSYSLQQILKPKNLYNNTSIMDNYWAYEKQYGGNKITVLRHYLQSIADDNNVVKLPKTARKVLLCDVGITENRFMSFMKIDEIYLQKNIIFASINLE